MAGPRAGCDLEVMRAHNHFKSAIGNPLHFAPASASPFYGLPAGASNWALVRLDRNEEGGVPLIDEVPVKVDGRQLLIHDLTVWGNGDDMGTLGGFPDPPTKVRGEQGSPVAHATRELLLATDHGLCVFNIKWGNCKLLKPEGLAGEVSLFMRDTAKRLWLGGRGLWVLRDQQHAVAVHPEIPMLADTRVLALAEAPDGRLVIGLEGRGAVFLTIPPGWFERPAKPPSELPPWENIHAHEPSYLDRCVVIRECPSKDLPMSAAITASLLSGLREFAQATGPRVHVAFEEGYECHPDIVVGGAELDTLMAGVMPLVEKLAGKARWSVSKRFGPRGSQVVEVRACPK